MCTADERRTAMAPPSLPQPPNRLPGNEFPDRPFPAERFGAPVETVHAPERPGGGHNGRPLGPHGLDRPASEAQPPELSRVFDLPRTPASVGLTRRHVRALLTAWGIPGETRDNAVLVTSELLTNALTHAAGTRIVCRVRITAERLRIEVEDEHPGLALARPALCRPDPYDQGGRGLFLVDELSTDWGVADRPDRSGHIVWAELTTAPNDAASNDSAPPAPAP
jgi:anti-sigma regulatory factor (Ser/Thr protein kinase)